MAKKTKEQLARDYDHLDTMEGLQAVREVPGMYVGSPQSLDGKNPQALIQIAQEILSNAVDEAYTGFGKLITMTVHKDNSMTVTDEGRGMPKGKDFDSVRRGFTVLHTSGKHNGDYQNSLGQNGVGIKSTTALSKYIKAEVVTSQQEHYEVEYHMETPVVEKDLPYKKDMHTGTKVTFLPDDEIFDTIVWDDKPLINKLEQTAFLTPGVKFVFTDERNIGEDGKPFRKEWLAENGMADYVSYIAQSEELVKGLKKPITFSGNYIDEKDNEIGVEGALIYTESSGETIVAFANGAPTIDGGVHIDGAQQSIYKAFSDFAKDKKLIKKGKAFDSSDARDGLILALLVKIPTDILIFTSQSKTKLVTVQAKDAAKQVVYDQLTKWLYDNESTAKRIITNMLDARDARNAAIQAKKAAKEARKTKDGGGRLVVSSKLKPASGRDPKTKSLFITEGDSASQHTILMRDKKHQAVFPLKGKILNTAEEKLSRVVQNVEVSTIASVLGAGIGPVFDVKDLMYDKVIILTDADDDGAHISSLITVLMYKFFPGLIEGGHLYKVVTPLYKIVMKNKKGEEIVELAYTEAEKPDLDKRVAAREKKGYKITSQERWKGLGSMSKKDTFTYIVNPETRKIKHLTITDANKQEAKDMLQLWMGNNAEVRKEQIEKTIDFDNIVLD